MIRPGATPTSHDTNAASTTVTVNHTVEAGEVLLVGVMAKAGSVGWGVGDHIVGDVTFNGVPMVLLEQFNGPNTPGSTTVRIYILTNPDPGTHAISFTHSGDDSGGIGYNGAVAGLSFFGYDGVGDSDNANQNTGNAQVILTTTKPQSLIFNVGLSLPSTLSEISGNNFADALLDGETNQWYEAGYEIIPAIGNTTRTILNDLTQRSTIVAVEITTAPTGGFFLKMIQP